MLSYGCTRLEIGLQSIFEDVARDTNRGHTVAAVGECFHLAKNAGFKVIAHMMPDLPNMGWERDMESFREFFENPDFRTDGLKVASLSLVHCRTSVLEMGCCNASLTPSLPANGADCCAAHNACNLCLCIPTAFCQQSSHFLTVVMSVYLAELTPTCSMLDASMGILVNKAAWWCPVGLSSRSGG